METLRNNWLKVLALILLIVLICLIPKCQNEPKQSINDFKPLIQKRDSIIKIVEYKDSIRTVYVTKWRKIKLNPDTLPCDSFVHEIISVCDTLILKDSSEIASLKDVIKQDSVIQAKYQAQILADSIVIATVNKKLKRQKFFTKAAFVGGLITGGAVMFKP